MFTIKSIEIEGFRGFAGKRLINLETPITILYGSNHQGKSSTLNAIEWGLFGDECLGEKSGIRERVGTGDNLWRIINDKSERAEVTLTLASENQEIKIIRAESKKEKGKYKKSVKVIFENELEKTDDEAEKEITKILGITFKDFFATSYQHQESIRDFIIQKTSDRSEAIDRLLGLSDYRNIIDAIVKSDVSSIQRRLAENFAVFQEKLANQISFRIEDFDKKKAALEKDGIKANEETLFELIQTQKEAIITLCKNRNCPLPEFRDVKTMDDVDLFRSAASDKLNEVYFKYNDIVDIKGKQNREKEKIHLIGLETQYKTYFDNYELKKKMLTNFEIKNGTKSNIMERLQNKKMELAVISKEISTISSRSKLIDEGISILEKAAQDQNDICPLCEQKTPNLLLHLKKEWKEKLSAYSKELLEKKKVKDQHIEEDEILQRTLNKLESEVVSETNNIKETINKISLHLNRDIKDDENPLAMLSKEIEENEKKLKHINNVIENTEKEKESVNQVMSRILLIYDLLKLEEKNKKFDEIKNREIFTMQDEIKNNISFFAGKVDDVVNIIKSSMSGEAREKIKTAGDIIDRYFRELTKNPAYQELKINVAEDKKKGGTIYAFIDQSDNNPLPVLSQGDLNSLALSLFLGLNRATLESSNLGVILMDDPSQSLAHEQKERLAELVNVISEGKRVIISTMDKEFNDLLTKKIEKRCNIMHFKNWKPEIGPEILKE